MKTQWIATVDTAYPTYAIADTEEEARKLALKSALKWLKARGARWGEFDGYGYQRSYTNIKQVEEWLGCNSYEIPVGQGTQVY